ncbi:MAG: FeoB-associated Cys-rich membrane protein [Ruminococcus sp.]|nr:FeoB-associated Cys-rich membrane protein [Ruminococcus sp.]MBQ9895008.1 FeoB-associated Cys-rich membrane protein [Ruminococcus sp.]MBR6393198.1 FeoB-associated Cys-rich membrane protein [Ruminococcus sp.]MCR5729844.1 FeoB-associated Cys-rich membrane protein [Ruminococcus sp.]
MRWVIVLLVLIAIVALIIYTLIRDKKAGKTSCGHGCQNCAMQGHCHDYGASPQDKK